MFRKKMLGLLLAVFWLAGFTAYAVADVELDSAPLQVANAILFKDHADPNLYYYMPNQPRLAYWPDGTPKLTFLKYTKAGKEEAKGGILHFFVKYGLDEQEAEQGQAGSC